MSKLIVTGYKQESQTPVSINRWCGAHGRVCEFANSYGYCQLTACVRDGQDCDLCREQLILEWFANLGGRTLGESGCGNCPINHNLDDEAEE